MGRLTTVRHLVLLALILWMQTAHSACAETRRALLIGIDVYRQNPILPPSDRVQKIWHPLQGPVNDLISMKSVLAARWGFDPANIVSLKNDEATKDKIMSEFQTLEKASAPGDVLLFYFAGHGSVVKNSRSLEPNQLDQTIVPADAPQHIDDKNPTGRHIRDKEIARLFTSAIQKGIVLTAIFDSCHSGDIARGDSTGEVYREAMPDPTDVADPLDAGPAPEERGALVFSACQDYELAGEVPDTANVVHGRFTHALVEAMSTENVNEPANILLRTVTGRIQGDGGIQSPVLAGTTSRQEQPLFGGHGGQQGSTYIAVSKITNDEIRLNGGLAIGLHPGCELTGVALPNIHLKIKEVNGLALSIAKVSSGSLGAVRPGSLFKVTTWVVPGEPLLRIWMPPANLTLQQIKTIAQKMAALRSVPGIQWVDDPSLESTSQRRINVMRWNGIEWELLMPVNTTMPLANTSDGLRIEQLGTNPDATAVQKQLVTNGTAPTRFFLQLPPPAELFHKLQLGDGTANDTVAIVKDIRTAQYMLIGKSTSSGLEYCWMIPKSMMRPVASANAALLPRRTDWIKIDDALSSAPPTGNEWQDAQASETPAAKLEDLALRLGKLRGWLTLASPPDEGEFPYSLAIRDITTKKVMTSGLLPRQNKHNYELVLKYDQNSAVSGNDVQMRFVYVFVIDRSGASKLMYPQLSGTENRLPTDISQTIHPPPLIELSRTKFDAASPFGLDNYILLTTITKITDPHILEFNGVSRGDPKGASALETLFAQRGSTSRGVDEEVPTDWSIQRIALQSVDAQ